MPEKPYTPLQSVGRIIIDAAGNPVRGYHIDLLSAKGMKGFVEIPEAQYTLEAIKALLLAEAKRLDDILGL